MTTVLGRFEILREIGDADAVGQALLARDTEGDREVTLRLLEVLAPLASELRQAAMDRALASSAGLEGVQAPGVVRTFGCADLDGLPALLHAPWTGEPCSLFCELPQLLAVEQVVELLASAADTLDAVARAGVIHGYLRPSGLLRASNGKALIADFGVAAALAAAGIEQVGLEKRAGYVPPEFLRGGAGSARGDQFSLAAIGFELLAGGPAFPGKDAASIAYRLLNEPPRDTSHLPRPIPPALLAPLLRALDPQPERRFASATEFAAELRRACAECRSQRTIAPSATTANGPHEPPRAALLRSDSMQPRSHGRTWVWIAGAGLAAVVVFLLLRQVTGFGAPREQWVEAKVVLDPPEARLSLDGEVLEAGAETLVRFRIDGEPAVLKASAGCRQIERELTREDAGGVVQMSLPPSRYEGRFEPLTSGAKVAIDGTRARNAPIDLALDLCQEHRLVVSAPGFVDKTIVIPEGATVPQARAHLSGVSLAPLPIGRLVLPNPEGLKLVWFVDGERVDASRGVLELTEGTHQLRYKNDFHWIDGTLDVSIAGGADVRPELKGLELAEIKVQAVPPNARVFLRRNSNEPWRLLGEAPATRRVAAGRYEVQVESNATGRKEVRTVTLKAGGDNPPVRVAFGSS